MKKLDLDIQALKLFDRGAKKASNPKMILACLEWVKDKYIFQPLRDAAKAALEKNQ